MNEYKYSSIPELNAVLKQFNVMADRGKEDSKIFQTKGLVYRILDQEGNPIGVPIKASSFYSKPTLKFLEEKFKACEIRKATDKAKVKNAIDIALSKESVFSLNDLAKHLEKEGINIVFRESEKGSLYGITYIDHTTKNVFNGSNLGKQYSAKAMTERCNLISINGVSRETLKDKLQNGRNQFNSEANNGLPSKKQQFKTLSKTENVISSFIQPELSEEYIPYQLKNKKRKRRKRDL